MNQKTVGLTLRATILALALILVVGSPALLPLDGVAYAQSAAPTLTATVSPNNSVAISWTAVDGADSYELYKQEEGAGSWNAIAVTGASHTDSAVVAGKSYFYIARAMTGGTAGAWSNTPKVTIPGGTTAPTGTTLSATVDGLTAIDLSWTAVSGADHYDLRRWNGATSSWDRIGGDLTGTTHADTGLTSGEQYWYVMRAVNAGGNGPWSSEGGVGYTTATLPTVSDTPTLSLTHPSRTTVVLSWTAVAEGAEYTVQRSKAKIDKDGKAGDAGDWSNLANASNLTATSHTDSAANYVGSGNETGTQYSYRVYALVNTIQSNYSNTVKVSIPATDTRPPVPADPAVAVGGHDRLNITWSKSDGATSYQVRHKRGDGSYSSATTRTSPWTHTGLSAETKYTYQVRAVNVNGSSDWSAAKSKTTSAATSPSGQLGVPSGLNAVDATTIDSTDGKIKASGIKVTWNSVSNATGYDLLIWEGNKWVDVDLKSSEEDAGEVKVTYTGVTANTEYHFVIRATADNKSDMGDWSAPVSVSTIAEKPKKPKSLTVSPTGESTIWISWADDGSGINAADSYTLQWRLIGSNAAWNSIPVDGTTHAHTGLRAATAYFYRVKAHNSGGESAYTATMDDTTWAQQLSTPTGLTAVGGDKKITLSWNAVSAATAYDLQEWSNNKWDDLGDPDVTVTTFTDEINVSAGGTYYYIVRAVNGDVKSDWSTPVAGSAKADEPTAVDLVLVPTGQTMVRLTWKAEPGATGYEMQWIDGGVEIFGSSTRHATITLSATPNYYAHTGLTAGTRYSYRLRAVLPQAVKSKWQAKNVQVVTRPLAPAGLSATAIDHNTMKLTFDAVTLEGKSLKKDYDIQRKKSGDIAWVTVTSSLNLTCDDAECSGDDDKDLEASTKYFYRIRATAKPDDGAPDVTSYWSMVTQNTGEDTTSN